MQLGIGADGSTPDTSWEWSVCTYNEDKDGLTPGDLANDEYACTSVLDGLVGVSDYAGRTRLGDGAWLYCDLGSTCGGAGSTDGYSPDSAGHLEIVGL